MAKQNLTDEQIIFRVKPMYDAISDLCLDEQIKYLYGFVGLSIDDFPTKSSEYIRVIKAIREKEHGPCLSFS